MFIPLYIYKNIFMLLRIAIGSICLIFVPGFILNSILYPEKNKINIGLLERLVLSCALSIASITLMAFYLNAIGMKINSINMIFLVAALIAVELFIKILQKR
jgi:uncharacterized membrane protein